MAFAPKFSTHKKQARICAIDDCKAELKQLKCQAELNQVQIEHKNIDKNIYKRMSKGKAYSKMTIKGDLTGEHILAVLVSLVYIYVASGLIFGTYKRSRICVTAMFILLTMAFANAMYNMCQEVLTTKEPPNDMIIIVPFIVVLYFIFEGIRGTFAYHKLIKNHENRKTEN